jgi:hypothetical protein
VVFGLNPPKYYGCEVSGLTFSSERVVLVIKIAPPPPRANSEAPTVTPSSHQPLPILL